ncbi:hypothetical protein HZB07_06660 [Candidatus Saganbacteria bacterium]|nr:hypothetical protein [Candidatus Saganbacteria bacterium]
MAVHRCPICDHEIDVPANFKPGQRLTCPYCFVQLALHQHKREVFLACPVCKEAVFDPQTCENCETRRDRKRFLDEGRL